MINPGLVLIGFWTTGPWSENGLFLRDPPEPTGEEPEDADFEAPKIYELVFFLFLFVFKKHVFTAR